MSFIDKEHLSPQQHPEASLAYYLTTCSSLDRVAYHSRRSCLLSSQLDILTRSSISQRSSEIGILSPWYVASEKFKRASAGKIIPLPTTIDNFSGRLVGGRHKTGEEWRTNFLFRASSLTLTGWREPITFRGCLEAIKYIVSLTRRRSPIVC